MLCAICKQREARIHLTQIVGDKIQKVDLCEQCAKAKGVMDSTSYALADLLLGMESSAEPQTEPPKRRTNEPTCSRCGMTIGDFKKIGRLGCPACYDTFREPISTMLRTMHRGLRHVGKVPKSIRSTKDLTEQIKQLQAQLKKAIEDENFELAAVLRDQIKELNARLNSILPSQSNQ